MGNLQRVSDAHSDLSRLGSTFLRRGVRFFGGPADLGCAVLRVARARDGGASGMIPAAVGCPATIGCGSSTSSSTIVSGGGSGGAGGWNSGPRYTVSPFRRRMELRTQVHRESLLFIRID